RKAVLTDGQEPLLRYIEAIHQVLMAEYKQWPGEQEQRSPVLDKLDSLLKQATAQSSGKEKKRPRKKAFEIRSLEPESKNTETLQAAPTMTFLHY
ncbi:MAG TPA: hypothetical protein VFT06_12720, partial [Flavisolibacter sp.]|nr:hypothetical protein [Flavisolibacter sp.]